jgi:hypothetical protein
VARKKIVPQGEFKATVNANGTFDLTMPTNFRELMVEKERQDKIVFKEVMKMLKDTGDPRFQ